MQEHTRIVKTNNPVCVLDRHLSGAHRITSLEVRWTDSSFHLSALPHTKDRRPLAACGYVTRLQNA